MNVVVVESPAKAKTINKYLGRDFTVLASYGHVRDLPAKDGSVRPADGFAMDWEVDKNAEKHLRAIANAIKDAENLYLATDPDREGEAISWHIAQELYRRGALDGVGVKRVVFNAVTKRAVLEAFAHPRDLNQDLIDAYLARRALDYLVGFTLSPVLWRKLPGSRSAGRVQSVALRLICDREAEIEVFKPQEYWTIGVALETPGGAEFSARLSHLNGRKLEKFDLPNEAAAQDAVHRLREARAFSVATIERKETRRNPQPPFTTSTLQQEASRKLGFGATKTMRTAQRLYEGADLDGETVGLITYMRTDGVQMSDEAIAAARSLVGIRFGDAYLPGRPRVYKSPAKNAQEAHEAIRPTDFGRRPEDVRHHLERDAFRLYELIWKRALASQMESARLDQVSVDVDVDGGAARLRATGSVVTFDGFLKLYEEGRDDAGDEGEEAGRRLPAMNRGERLSRRGVEPEQHFTQPPPRYSEASLVKKLEELGIGRPSTYAQILQVLQDRNYVRLERRRFVPEDRGRLVTTFLASFFERYVQYGFTAEMEEQLDQISGGRIDWKKVLQRFWEAFKRAVDGTAELSIGMVIQALDEALGPHFFPSDPQNPDRDPRACPGCGDGRLGLKFGRNGGFIGCSRYPECTYTRPLTIELASHGGNGDAAGPRVLGEDPETNLPVALRKGPFGWYVQLGEGEDNEKPKRVSLPRGLQPGDVTLDTALKLLSLPREVGRHPETGEPIIAGIGRYGPYVRHENAFRSLPNGEDVLTVGLNRAVALLAEAPARRGPLKTLGEHPSDGKPVAVYRGRYGPFVRHGKVFASLPKGTEPESVTLDSALELLAAQTQKVKGKGGTKATRRSKKGAATRKPAAREATK